MTVNNLLSGNLCTFRTYYYEMMLVFKAFLKYALEIGVILFFGYL